MKNIKNQKGAISIFVILAMLFFLAFMLGAFSITSRRNATQLESVRETAKIYSSGVDADSLYDSMLSTSSNIVNPITTIEQLKEVKRIMDSTDSSLKTNYTINGKLYTYKKDASYILANDIILELDKEFDKKIDVTIYDYMLYNKSKYKIELNNHNIYYRLADGSLWKCVFYQDNGTKDSPNLLTKTGTTPNAGKSYLPTLYSILDNGIEEFYKVRKQNNGTDTYNYEFLLMYNLYYQPSGDYTFDATKYHRWGQNNNPAKESISDDSGIFEALGYTTDFANSSTFATWENFGGLTRSTNDNAYLDGVVGSNYWWFCVGLTAWETADTARAMPAINFSTTTNSHTYASECLLFVRAD